MQYLDDYRAVTALPSIARIVTIGNFDGVHLGHREVMAGAREEANRRGMELAALTFEPHPANVLNPEAPRLRLATPNRKTSIAGIMRSRSDAGPAI